MHTAVTLLLLVSAFALAADLPPQECPSVCKCVYSRINWVAECSHRGLKETPEGLSPTTYTLDLSENRLEELILPPEVQPSRLLLANNNFRQITQNQYQGMNSLLDVDMSGNHLTYVDPNTFNDCPGLLSLYLRGNSQLEGPTDPESPFLKSRSLRTLDLAQCGISRVGEGFLQATPSLRKLDLSNNPLTTIDCGAFSTLSNLQEVHLSNTNLKLLSFTFPTDAPLHFLDLSGTKLDANDLVPLLERLSHIEHLDLSKTEMTLNMNQHGATFQPAKWLNYLNLEGNNLSDLDMSQTLDNLEHLETLDLSYCSLNSNSFGSDASLRSLTRLRALKLAGNKLSTINMTSLMESFSKLHTLTLRDCGLTSTEFLRELIPLRQSLRSLDLADNPLGNNQVNAAGSIFPLLESLDVSRCQLTRVTNTAFSSAMNLVNLVISGNLFRRLDEGALSSLTKLESLHMENCGVQGAPAANVFPPGPVAPLKELRMAGNPLEPEVTTLVPRYLAELTFLDVSRSGIQKLPATSIRHARNLEKLILADNLLQGVDALPANLASLAPNLHKLDLQRCKLQSLDIAIIAGNSELTKLYLNGNPWHCDCAIESLWRWATSKGVALHEKGGEDTLRCTNTDKKWSSTLDFLNCT